MKTKQNKTNEEIWQELNTHENSCKYGQYVIDFIGDNILTVCEFNEYEDLGDLISDSMGRDLIYYDDQWELMKAYQNPDEANYRKALELLYDDIYEILSQFVEED